MAHEKEVLQVLRLHPLVTRSEIASLLVDAPSDSTLKRTIASAVEEGLILRQGRGPATRYQLSPQALVTLPIDIVSYFVDDVDQRQVKEQYNFELIRDILPSVVLFSQEEERRLNSAQQTFRAHIEGISDAEYRKEMERLGVDLSWKSSQIEGNTYSLLETERLLKERKEASGKTREEAVMLLNHKDALDFILNSPDYLQEITLRRIEDIHSILTKDLNIARNIRSRRVGITGTNYRPLDNDFQIREAVEDSCALINSRKDVFEKALLCLLLLSYIQPFVDGNKRTARITANAILIAYGYSPISFRSVDSMDYKKAMLLFYEQNNLSAFKHIFIEQFEFAVGTYF